MTDPKLSQPGAVGLISGERIRELRDSHMVKVRNLPQPTLDELVKLLNSTEDLSVQILPNGEVLATTCPDSTAFVAICDELLRHRAQAGWVPVSERLPTAAGFYLVTGSTDEGVPFVWTSSFTPNIGTKHPPYWSANEVIAWQELRFPAPYKVTP